ncbi:MAG TPA: GIY-YIG nuclease family protein, partial [Firmicutes bacterium]|nr:GIY-YIG nuclease family protein [Bacillota bacterium]
MEQRKKELKEQYKQMKPEMGILMVTSLANNKHFLIAAPNLRGMEN